MATTLRFATRPSALARWQTRHVMQSLQARHPDLTCEEVVITTRGDRVLDRPLPEIGGKGLFTLELEQALLSGEVDAAVHSLKDLPTENTTGLSVEIIPERADPRDVLIAPSGQTLDALPAGAVVGTSSTRRRAQLLAHRPDLIPQPIRGNVDTRIRKAEEGQYHAILLAAAGVTRLGLESYVTEYLPLDWMLPAPGQGALAVQQRDGDTEVKRILQSIHHPPTHLAVTAERAFLAALGGGCSLPVAALASWREDALTLHGAVAAPDGSRILRLNATEIDPTLASAAALGRSLAEQALENGAAELLSS